MEHDNTNIPLPSSPSSPSPTRQVRLFAIANELNSLSGQDQRTVAHGLFTALARTTGAHSGRLFLVGKTDKPEYCLVLANEHVEEFDELTSPPLHEQALAGWAYRLRRAVLITDTTSAPHWSSWAQYPEAASARSAVAAPILIAAQPIGALALISEHPNHFNENDLALIAGLADQAATIIENARLTTLVTQKDHTIHHLTQETAQRLQELAFLNETGQAITSTLDLDKILHLLLERVRGLLQIDAASIALQDARTGDLVFEAASGEGSAEVLGARLKPGQGIAGWVAETGKPLFVEDVYRDVRFFPEIDRVTQMKTRAVLCIPIVLKGRVVGVIEALNPRETPFDAQAIELLNALSGLAATAIDNARLFAEVRNAEARYGSLFEDSADSIVITDLNGTIVEANRNACALWGQDKEAFQGTKLANLRSPDGSPDFGAPLKQIQAGQETTFQTVVLSNGQRKTMEIRGKQILVKDTPLVQWIGRDISAELELEQTRQDMVRMLIHDLRNPLANIMNSLDVLHDVITNKDDRVSQEDVIKIAKRSGQRMHQLISSILDISRLETGGAILATQPTDLLPVLRDAIEFMKPQTDIREIQLSESFAPNLPHVEIDSDMISRVVLNLLDNACKFTQLGGTISLTANVLGTAVEVAITDNGTGIPPDQLQRIFEKFTRVRRKDGPTGTGLGLAFCKLAIEAHGGRIWAESIGRQGTTIRFTLPAYTPEQALS